MSSSFTQTFPVGAGPDPVGATTKEAGPPSASGPPPVPAGVWDTVLTASVLLPQGSAMDLTLDTGLSSEPLLVETVMQTGIKGVFLTVDGWLQVGSWSSPAGTAWSVSASLGGEAVEAETTSDPSLPSGTWTRVQVLLAHDQLTLSVGGTLRLRMPIAERFNIPTPLITVRVENTDPTHGLGLAVVSVRDDVPDIVTAAAAVAETAGFGEVRGAFHRAGKAALGGETSAETGIPGGRMQTFEAGLGYWTRRSGGVVVDGPVAERYVQMGSHNGSLGLPLTDTQAGTAPYITRARHVAGWRAGDNSRMSRFEHGVIAWSEETGAHEVLGRVAEHWLVIGGPASPVGLPVGQSTESRHGMRHAFQFGDIFERWNSSIAAVHGEILRRYDELGAWGGVLGAPLTDEQVVHSPGGAATDGRVSLFEHGSITWSPTTGVHELLEPWYSAYVKQGGPSGDLGLPTSGVQTAGSNGVTYTEFEHGLMVNHVKTGVRVVTTIEVTLVEAKAPSIDDGWEPDFPFPSRDHDAELITRMSVLRDGSAVAGWDQRRFPASGHAGKSVSFGNATVEVPVVATTIIIIVGTAEDHDELSGNDNLGGITRSYAIDTLWGELGPVGPAYSETGTGGDGSVVYKYAIGLPSGPISPEFRVDRWWQYTNGSTDDVSYPDYSQAFEDVEAHGDWWDTVTNPLDHLFYELAIRNIAEKGNCYGMSNSALHALCAMNAYRLPLSRYATAQQKVDDAAFPAQLREDLNSSHAQQLNAAVLSHMLGKISLGPVLNLGLELGGIGDIITGGDLAIISFVSITEGKGHSVLGYGYLPRPGFPDSILVADPNVPFAKNGARSGSRIDLDNSGGWEFIDDGVVSKDYRSNRGAMLFRIPSWVVRGRSITPMAALGLGVAQLVSSFVVVGGEVNIEQVGLGGANASLTQLPIVESSPNTRLYAGQGPAPSTASSILVSRGPVEAGVYFRSANVAAGARLNFDDRSVIAHVRVDGFDGIRPTLEADIATRPAPAHLHLGTSAGRAQRPGWSASADVSLGGPQTATFGFAPVGIGVVLEGLAAGPAPQVQLRRDDLSTSSRFVLDDAVAGKRMELRPADMASPFGAQILSGLGKDIAIAPMP